MEEENNPMLLAIDGKTTEPLIRAVSTVPATEPAATDGGDTPPLSSPASFLFFLLFLGKVPLIVVSHFQQFLSEKCWSHRRCSSIHGGGSVVMASYFYFADFIARHMSARNRGLPLSMKGLPHEDFPPPIHEPAFHRGLGPIPHPAFLEDIRESQFGMGPRPLRTHPTIIEEHLAAQHREIQGLLHVNQGLAATHVTLRLEVESAQHKLAKMEQYASSVFSNEDTQMRELHEKAEKLEMDFRALEAMKAELMHVRADVKELTTVKQDLMGRVQLLNQDLGRATTDLQQLLASKAEIDRMRQELQQARYRASIEYEKKGYAENYEHGQVMEKKLVAMAREVEKLRAEMANAEKRARAAGAVGNAAGYAGNPYPTGFAGHPYPSVGYGMKLAGAENYSHYGHGPGTWAPYEAQRPGNR
ncbi:FLX-like 1-like protein [Drosera capensis]